VTLAATTESRLSCAASDSGAAYAELVTGMEGLVQSMAKRHTNGSGPDVRAELESEGRHALCEAVVTFAESGATCRFSTYAGQRMNRAMVSYLRTADGTGTEWRARAQQHARTARRELTDLLGEHPTQAELVDYAGEAAASAVETQLSHVQLSDAGHEIAFVPVNGDDEAEFERRRGALSMADSALLDEVVDMGMFFDGDGYIHYRSDGVSLAEVAVRIGGTRDEIEARLGSILDVMVCDANNDA
jgi:hypothetical protein